MRLDFKGGGGAVLYNGFTVMMWHGCSSVGPCGASPGGDQGWHKAPVAATPGLLALQSDKGLLMGIAKAYAVAPGVLLPGQITHDASGGVVIHFDLRGVPATDYDVLLFTSQDTPLLLEGFITSPQVETEVPARPEDQNQPKSPAATPPESEEPPAPTNELNMSFDIPGKARTGFRC